MTCVVIRKSAIENTLLFDERLRYQEDANFFLKLAYKVKSDYCDEPLAKYYVTVNSRTLKQFSILAEERDVTLQGLREEFPEIDEKLRWE